MMTETMSDPFDSLFDDDQMASFPDGLLFTNEVMFGEFNNNSSSISPISNSSDHAESEFDPTIFEKLLNELMSSDPTIINESSFDISLPLLESEPNTREMGTDPMEQMTSSSRLIINTPKTNQLLNNPIFIIKQSTGPLLPQDSTFIITAPITTTTVNDDQMGDFDPMTPSPSSGSADDEISTSPDIFQDNNYSSLLTNFDNLPSTGPLVLTGEEVKLIKQDGHKVPTKLPLSKTEEKMLKKIRRKIKNKISAQESRRKKKDYVDALEKQIAKYINENNALKQRVTTIEKNQKTLTKERDTLRSMIGKATPAPSTGLMVFALFFAVLFGAWSPLTNKSSLYDRSLSLENALIPSQNYQSALTSRKSLLEQQEGLHSNYATDNHKSRVLLSTDDYDNHHHGPYLPSNNQVKLSNEQQTAAPGYTYSNTVEKYMNKKIQSGQLKRSFVDESPSIVLVDEPVLKKIRSNYHINENIVVIEETNDEFDNGLNENKSVKIIRVERTVPAIGNDTLKLAHRTANE